MSERSVDCFFYGLFMDEEVLVQAGVSPFNSRQAYVSGFKLQIGARATLVPDPGAISHGMVISLSHSDLDRLYGAPGLEGYRPEAVLAHIADTDSIPALCYNLVSAPGDNERNPEYARRLGNVLRKLKFPPGYVASIARSVTDT